MEKLTLAKFPSSQFQKVAIFLGAVKMQNSFRGYHSADVILEIGFDTIHLFAKTCSSNNLRESE